MFLFYYLWFRKLLFLGFLALYILLPSAGIGSGYMSDGAPSKKCCNNVTLGYITFVILFSIIICKILAFIIIAHYFILLNIMPRVMCI